MQMPSSAAVGGGGGAAEATTSNTDTENPQLIRKCDAEPLDVFTGRGHFSHPGNTRFLRLVAERKAEYVSAKYSQKENIATEVVELVYTGAEDCDGGGSSNAQLPVVRFLQIETGDPKDPQSLWRVITGKEVMDKVKMKLRQKQRGDKHAGAATNIDGDQSGTVTFGTTRNDGVKCDAKKSGAGGANSVGETATVSPCSANNDSGSCTNGPLYHGADPPALSLSSSRSSGSGDRRQYLLSVLNCARTITIGLRSKYDRRTDLEAGAISSQNDLDRNLTKDLCRLGTDLYSMLTQAEGTALVAAMVEPTQPMFEDSFSTSSDVRLAKRHGRSAVSASASPRLPLTDFGYPTNLGIFVSSLLDSGSDYAEHEFASISEVDDELRMMIEFPEKFLFDLPPSASTGTLNFPDKMYGQDQQRAKLINAFESVLITCEDARGLAVISGRAGSGKTSLVSTLSEPLSERGGKVIPVKFNKQVTEQPISEIFRSFDTYCLELQQADDTQLYLEVGASVKSALGSACQILATQMPNILNLTGDMSPGPHLEMDSKEMYNFILFALRVFVRAIASPSRPIVILFDDIQWADEESLSIIKRLITDTEIPAHSVLFAVCYREEEVQTNHSLMEVMGQISLSGIPMWNIFTEALTKENVNELISEALHLFPRLTAPLAKEVFNKTQGNAMFVHQLLQSLCDDSLLKYSASERRWCWDIGSIRSMSVPDSAVGLLLDRMKSYDATSQWVLQIAALIGYRFDASTMQVFGAGGSQGSGSSILLSIDSLIEDGMLCLDGAKLRFAHDQVWAAAASLTPVDCESMHLFIGRQLLKGASSHSRESVDIHLYEIVDQMNRGVELIQDGDEKLTLAELNSRAGKMSVESCSFLQASIYFLQGTVLLDEGKVWESNYSLALELYTGCAETQLALGSHSLVETSANPILANGKCLYDKLRAYMALVTALVAQGKLSAALSQCLEVLKCLGEPLADQSSTKAELVQRELIKTEEMVSTFRLEDIMSMPILTDENKVYAMRFLVLAIRIYFAIDPRLYALSVLRCMAITFTQGLTPEASIAVAAYASILCKLGLFDDSARFARVAVALLEKYRNRHGSSVHLILNLSILPYKQPLPACSEALYRSYKDTIATGVTEWALLTLYSSAIIDLLAPDGRDLHEVGERYSWVIEELLMNDHYQALTLRYYQMVLIKLSATVHSSDDGASIEKPSLLNEESVWVEERFQRFQAVKTIPRNERIAFFCRLFLAYQFRNYEETISIAAKVQNFHLSKGFSCSFELIHEAFYIGLVAMWIVRRGGDDSEGTWISFANDILAKMKLWSDTGSSWNFKHKYQLLFAEHAFVAGEMEVAAASYDKAIQGAKDRRFVNEAAVASECCGLFHLEYDNLGEARKYLTMAEESYRLWGALRKAEDVRSRLQSMPHT